MCVLCVIISSISSGKHLRHMPTCIFGCTGAEDQTSEHSTMTTQSYRWQTRDWWHVYCPSPRESRSLPMAIASQPDNLRGTSKHHTGSEGRSMSNHTHQCVQLPRRAERLYFLFKSIIVGDTPFSTFRFRFSLPLCSVLLHLPRSYFFRAENA